MSSTVDELKQLIHRQFDIPIEKIDEHSPFSDYDLDSLTLAELVFAVDDEFHVVIPDTAFGELRTLAQLADLVDGLRVGSAGAPQGSPA